MPFNFTGLAIQYGAYVIGIISNDRKLANYYVEKCSAVIRPNITIPNALLFKSCEKSYATLELENNLLRQCIDESFCPPVMSNGAAIGIAVASVIIGSIIIGLLAVKLSSCESNRDSCWAGLFSTQKTPENDSLLKNGAATTAAPTKA